LRKSADRKNSEGKLERNRRREIGMRKERKEQMDKKNAGNR
jgi:hypothetical protein